MSYAIPEQVAAANKANIDLLLAVAQTALSTAESLAALNLHLAANAIPGAVLSLLATAVGQISAGTDSGKLARVRAAQLLVLASPDYLIQQ